MLSHKRDYAAVLGRPTTSQPYAFLHKVYVRSGPIHGVVHRPSHYDTLSGEDNISRSLGHCDRRMIMFSDRPRHVPPTIADTGNMDPSVGEDS